MTDFLAGIVRRVNFDLIQKLLVNPSAVYLVLSDGTVFEGKSLGAVRETVGEVVFNTGLTGYQEILTDPSYANQIVLLTYPLIGNYGINEDDFESAKLQPSGLIVREACENPSNWRSKHSLDSFLKEKNFAGIQGIDTRVLAQHIRSNGVIMGAITAGDPATSLEKLKSSPDYAEQDYVYSVSTKAPYAWGYEGRENLFDDSKSSKYKHTIAVLDCGLKYNILRRFAALGVRTIIWPATTPAEELMEWNPDGILLSPGPGDPARLDPVIETVKNLLGQRPIFGICLGNQLLCHALGGKTYKLPFGHRGSNHPVKDLEDGSVTITSQNHGFAVEPDSLEGTDAVVSQINVNDGSVEGIRVKKYNATSIQYHPEAAPGPWDSRKYFHQFVESLKKS